MPQSLIPIGEYIAMRGCAPSTPLVHKFCDSAGKPCEQRHAIVVGVGVGVLLVTGERAQALVAVGDEVVLRDGAGDFVESNGELLSMVREADILAVVRPYGFVTD